MTTNEFLQKVVKSQDLTKQMLDDLVLNRDEVESFLREKFGDQPIIRYGGSKAKGTMIMESYDLDMVCYFPRECNRDIKEIYDDVSKKLSEKYCIAPKTSAIRIEKMEKDKTRIDYHIDVVPGRFIDDKKEETFLHVKSGQGGWIKTDLQKHIKFILNSGCSDIIKLSKLWRTRNNINLKTFFVELLVVKALEGSRHKENLQLSFITFLEYLRDGIKDARLEDPANTNNVVSENWSENERKIISSRADESLRFVKDNLDQVDGWRDIFKEIETDKYVSSASIIVNKERLSNPWSV